MGNKRAAVIPPPFATVCVPSPFTVKERPLWNRDVDRGLYYRDAVRTLFPNQCCEEARETELSRAHDVAQWSFVYDRDGNTYALLWTKKNGRALVPGDEVRPGCYRYPDEVVLWPLVDPDTGETYRRCPPSAACITPPQLDGKHLDAVYPGQRGYIDFYKRDQKMYNDYVLETRGVKRLMMEPWGEYNIADGTIPVIDEVTGESYLAYYDPSLGRKGITTVKAIRDDCLLCVANTETGEVWERDQVEIYPSEESELFYNSERRGVLAKAKIAAQKEKTAVL